jgi:hypothetical protein
MPELFDFEVSLTQSSKAAPAQVVVFFTGPESITDIQVTDALQNRLPSYILPDHVIFLLPKCHETSIEADRAVKSSPLSIALQRRGPGSSPSYGFAYYDEYGAITTYTNAAGTARNLSKLLVNGTEKVVKAGMTKLVKCTSVLTKAPAGFLFSKPSSRSSNYFIRAENLLSETLHAHFLAFASLKMLKLAALGAMGEPDTIYLDTMAFLPIAFSIQLYQAKFGKQAIQNIKSFHSHDGLKDGALPNGASALCLISASTNCGLAKEWVRINSAPSTRVATFLSFQSTSEACTILHTLEQPDDFEMLADAESSESRQMIRIHGERFVAQHTETRLLNISMEHLPEGLQKRFYSFMGKNLFRCFSEIPNRNRRRTVCIDKDNLVKTSGFEEWFQQCLDEESPASTSLVIYDNDSASEYLAVETLKFLHDKGLTKCEMINEEKLDTAREIHGSVIIVAAAAERGSVLLSISRRLRSAQKSGTRLYIVAALFGRSYELMKDLGSNLTQPPKGHRRYVFKKYMEIPAASLASANHWSQEYKQLGEMVSVNGAETPPIFMGRIAEFDTSMAAGFGAEAFWRSSFTNKELKLTKGFAFVDGTQDVTNASSVDIFLTILWILQNARENAKNAKKLESGELQQVLLTPDVFSRYDDGIIQAAFLRAALPSELDYSAHETYSTSMSDIISRVAQGYGFERGEATVEFLVALATGKIRLHKNVDKNLRSALKAILVKSMPRVDLLLDGNFSPF